jgi:hypothetical protein
MGRSLAPSPTATTWSSEIFSSRAIFRSNSALRGQILLVLTAEGWSEWSSALRKELAQLEELSPATVATIFAKTLTARPIFCDLLAQAPLNLERNVSLDAVRAFKLIALNEVKVTGNPSAPIQLPLDGEASLAAFSKGYY